MKERIAILDGVRTPQGKAGGVFKDISADDLGVIPVKEILAKTNISEKDIDEVIIGNVAQPANAANIARVIALKAGIPTETPAMTVHRNCASGMESISTGAQRILSGEADIILAGGTESMSNIPLLFNKKMTTLFERLSKSKTIGQKLKTLLQFRLHFLKPVIGVMEGLTDPVCGLIMGLTAENIAREFHISREDQDAFALKSHLNALKATEEGILGEEIVPVPIPSKYDHVQTIDEGPRQGQSIEALQKLRPFFDRKNGTVTVGNACPLTDGAAAVILTSESYAKEKGYKPLGYVREYAYAGLDPHRMGLGPVYATSKLLDKTGLNVSDFDLVEINEAFAAQVLACLAAFKSEDFAKKCLNKDTALGEIDQDRVNVNGGGVALGHPVGTSGTRIVITLLKELRRRNLKRGLASLCVGGGQGGAFILETE